MSAATTKYMMKMIAVKRQVERLSDASPFADKQVRRWGKSQEKKVHFSSPQHLSRQQTTLSSERAVLTCRTCSQKHCIGMHSQRLKHRSLSRNDPIPIGAAQIVKKRIPRSFLFFILA